MNWEPNSWVWARGRRRRARERTRANRRGHTRGRALQLLTYLPIFPLALPKRRWNDRNWIVAQGAGLFQHLDPTKW